MEARRLVFYLSISPSALYFEPLVRRSEHEFFAGYKAGSLRGELETAYGLLCPLYSPLPPSANDLRERSISQ